MILYLGTDHRGFGLKEYIKKYLADAGHVVNDLSSRPQPGDDYPLIARSVVEKLRADGAATDPRGLLFCGSGAGIAIAANRFPGMRAALGVNAAQVEAARHDDNVNILAIAADYTPADEARTMVDAFLATPFEPTERYERRIQELDTMMTEPKRDHA